MTRVGILATGAYLPNTVRANDWWPESVVSRWSAKLGAELGRPIETLDFPITDDVRKTYAALQRYRRDPFQGTRERRVMADDMRPSDMEALAATDALQRAGVRPEDVDFIITYSAVPDYLMEPNASSVAHAIGLREQCFSLAVEAVCNSFLTQLHLAQGLIGSGSHKIGLLVQSSNLTAVMPSDQAYSAWFGDGATAVVVGPVTADRGLLGWNNRTNGALQKLMVGGVPGKKWFEDGRTVWYAHNSKGSLRMILEVAARGKEVVDASLEMAGLNHDDVDFYASHQATAWFREVTQEHIGLRRARHLDTFAGFGSLFGANIPLQLHLAAREGTLRTDDVVAMYSGASGVTWSGAVVRWGR